MVVDAEYAAKLKEVWDDPDQFRSRLVIENLQNRTQMLGDGVRDPDDPESTGLLPEQLDMLNALRQFSFVVAIKPRQVGFTTLTTLWFFAKTYRAKYPHRVLQTCHEPMAVKRVRKMVEVAYEGLPPELQFGMKSNAEVTEFGHNGAAFHRALAGARGQGRSWTYNDAQFTEMGKYPKSSSARTAGDEEADADLFASVQATIHDPDGQVVVESTGNGPYGLFYELVSLLAEDPTLAASADGIGFVFVPWSKVARYRRPVPPDFEPTDEERALMTTFGLDLGQIAWRRWKMKTSRMTRTRFQREYPLTWNEPFRIETAGWFSSDALNALAARVPVERMNDKAEFRQWEPPLVGRYYFIGVDTSGGVGRDEAVIVVLRDDLVQVAQWQSRKASPTEQALMVNRIAGLYRGLVLVENNKYGKQVNETLEKLGVKLWMDDENRYFCTTGSNAGDSKREMMTWARDVVDGMMCEVADPGITHQLSLIVEKSLGNIEARDERHDDRAIAFCLALWCARKHIVHHRSVDPDKERGKMLMALAKDHSRFWMQGGR